MLNGIPDFHQSVEMMKNMWSSAAKTNAESANSTFGFSGMGVNPFGIPMVDIEELDKRIKDLKSVEAWLTLNLNILQTTIQGLEVQKATLSALQGIAETMKASSAEASPSEGSAASTTPHTTEFAGAGGKLAQDLMDQMSKSMTTMMSSFPGGAGPKAKKTATPRKPKASSTTAKTAKPRPRQTRA
jgi:hypothetical protein